MKTRILDNPNPRANIAILISPHLFFIHAFETVLENLQNAEFVPDFTVPVVGESYPESQKQIVQEELKRRGFYWRDLEFSDRTPAEFFDKYALLVAPFYGGLMTKPYNENKKKVRIFYGNAKDSWGFGLWNAHFDLILCPGRYAEEHLSLYSAQTVAVGEPKLDGLYRQTKDKKTLMKDLHIPTDPNKENLLYLPTWGSLSSTSITIPALIALTNRYTVIVKLHRNTILYDSTELRKLQNTSLVLIDDEVRITDALQLADIVISDNSGSIFDALAADKLLVLIDTIGENQNFFVERPFFGFINGKSRGAPTHKDSIEQIIKRPDMQIAPVVKVQYGKSFIDASDLERAIQNVRNPAFAKHRNDVVEKVFAYKDSEAGRRAAVEIKKLLYQNPSERDNTLERFVDEFEQRLRSEISSKVISQENEKLLKLESLEKIKQLPYFNKIQALLKEYF